MRLSQSFLSSLARTQGSLVKPDIEDQEIIVPPVVMASHELPFALEQLSTVPVTTAFRSSVIVSDLAAFAVGAVARTFLVLDRGVWSIAWNVEQSVENADAALQTGLQMRLLAPIIQSVTLAAFVASFNLSVANKMIVSIPEAQADFVLVMGGTAVGVGQIAACVAAHKLL